MRDPSFNVLHRRLPTGRPSRKTAPPDGAVSSGAPESGADRDAELIEALPYGTLVLDAERHVAARNARLSTLLSIEPDFFTIGEPFASLARRASLRGERCLLGLGSLLDAAPAPGEERMCSVVNGAGVPLIVQSSVRPGGGFVLSFVRPISYNGPDRRLTASELLDNLPGAVIRCVQAPDGAQLVIFASRDADQVFGVDHEALVGKDVRSFLDTDGAEALVQAIRKSAADGTGFDLMLHVRNATGRMEWARCVGRAGHDERGAVVWDSRLVDADARVRAEAERKRLQTLLDNVVENVPHIVTVREASSMSYRLLNRAAEDYMGIPRETLIGQPGGRIFGQAASDRQWELTRQLIETGQPMEMPEMVIETAGRGRRVLRGRKYPLFDEEGKVEYVLTITEDLTNRRAREQALRRSEQRLREAIESFTDGLALYDEEDRLVLCNRRYRDMWPGIAELTQPGVSYAKMVRAVVCANGFDRTIQDVDGYVASRVNRHRNPPATSEHKMSNGRWLHVTHRATAEGGISVTCTDITALKEREERLRQAGLEAVRAKEAAEAANRSKSDFLANMSHELRTPLNAVIGFSEIIKDALLGKDRLDDYREYARDIHESGRHLLELINDILDMSKIEAGKLELFEETLLIDQVIDPCLKLVRDRATRSGIELDIRVQERLPRIRGDIRKLKQILINLLSNSVKFTPPGGRVTVEAFVQDTGEFVLRVADTGSGIRPEDIERALEPFSQIDAGLSRSHEGTGLGLTLTKALTELHGGKLQIDTRWSEPPTGTTVSAILPASRTVRDGGAVA